jgi:hypothetical protein
MYRLHALWDGAWSLLLLPTGILAAAACALSFPITHWRQG